MTKTPTMIALAATAAIVLGLASCIIGLPLLALTSSQADACAGGTLAPGDSWQQWNGDQIANATQIVTEGQALGVPPRAYIIALATSMQESELKIYANDNPAYPRVVALSMALPHEAVGHDHDSVGLFQQRPIEGAGSWGTVQELMTPSISAEKFYQALLKVPGWQQMRLTDAAQAVQHSGTPEAYQKHEAAATDLAAHIVSGDPQEVPDDLSQCMNICPSATASPDETGGSCIDVSAVFTRAQSWLTAWPGGGPVPYLSSNAPADLFQGYRRDCSGYVSMALGLPGPGLDTIGLAQHSTIITKTDLRQGDLMINSGTDVRGHVVVFVGWTDTSMTAYWGYEQSGDSGTHYRKIPYPYFGTYPMTPYQFGN